MSRSPAVRGPWARNRNPFREHSPENGAEAGPDRDRDRDYAVQVRYKARPRKDLTSTLEIAGVLIQLEEKLQGTTLCPSLKERVRHKALQGFDEAKLGAAVLLTLPDNTPDENTPTGDRHE